MKEINVLVLKDVIDDISMLKSRLKSLNSKFVINEMNQKLENK